MSKTNQALEAVTLVELRDRIAMSALQGMLANRDLQCMIAARASYEYADALLAIRSLSVDGEPEKKRSKGLTRPDSVSEQVWSDFVTHRKARKSPVTQTVLDTIEKEAAKVPCSMEEAIKTMIGRNWQGFKAEWVLNEQGAKNGRTGNANGELFGHAAWSALGDAARRKSEQDRSRGYVPPLPPELAD